MEEYFKYNPDESFDSFVNNSLKSLGMKNLNSKYKIITETQFPLIILASKKDEKYEIEIVQQDNNYYLFRTNKIPKSFKLKFGCELETCFNLDCTTDVFNNFFRTELDKFKLKFKEFNGKQRKETWGKLIQFHLKINIIPFLSKTFLKRYKYAYIMSYHGMEAIYLDLSNGEEIINNKIVDNYKTLQFAQDGSVKCGDSNPEDTSLSVHCEIITPILNSLSDIRLLYDNLISKNCNSSNSSSGFHVNISIVDENDNPVKLTYLYKFEFANTMYKFEKDKYELYRGSEGTRFALSIAKYIDNNIEDMIKYIKTKDGKEVSINDFTEDYGIKNLYYPNIMMYEKYRTIYHKEEANIFEFRIYPSKNDKNLLINYTEEALEIMKNTMSDYMKNCEKIYSKYIQIRDKYNILIEDTKENEFVYFRNYEGKFSEYLKLMKTFWFFKKYKFYEDYDGPSLEYYQEFEAEIEKESIIEVPFLFFFTDVRKVNKKIKIEGLQEGTYIYTIQYIDYDFYPYIKSIYNIKISYNSKEDYIKIIT